MSRPFLYLHEYMRVVLGRTGRASGLLLKRMSDTVNSKREFLSFRMHPRVLTALGRDLVTSDVVAVIELVKNSYDALATRVDIRLAHDADGTPEILVEDDGHGMTRSIVEDVWCVVATPYRRDQSPTEDGRSRRVTGDKGLGRLSAARLGNRLDMVTKAPAGGFLHVVLDWDDLTASEDWTHSQFMIEGLASDPDGMIESHGTRLRIAGLRSEWRPENVEDLRDNLARLVSPFRVKSDFWIYLSTPDAESGEAAVKIESPEFLSKPKYAVRGIADAEGNVRCKYEFQPIREGQPRQRALEIPWSRIFDELDNNERSDLERSKATCGAFEFEIRAWDLASDDTLEIQERFDISKTSVRAGIRAHKGISIYRDEILVLPKSEGARDWLGLDLRRVSRVGPRLSTSQIVGYVRITKADNPRIEDTSDRERLASNSSVIAFEAILKEVVAQLEVERDQDRVRKEEDVVSLFDQLTAEELLAEMLALAAEAAPASEAVPQVREFAKRLDRVRQKIQRRFIYYSRLATVGTIAQMLIHEIRNRTTAIGRFLRKAPPPLRDGTSESFEKSRISAVSAVEALERLADRFAPLASRTYRRANRVSVLEEAIRRSIELLQRELSESGIEVLETPSTETEVRIDPGELDPILLNLMTNAIYWLRNGDSPRQIQFRISRVQSGRLVRVHLDDSGPGILREDTERVFWPGVTRKPGGIGMGLTVASELVAEHGGKMALMSPGRLGGATFQFDLPVRS